MRRTEYVWTSLSEKAKSAIDSLYMVEFADDEGVDYSLDMLQDVEMSGGMCVSVSETLYNHFMEHGVVGTKLIDGRCHGHAHTWVEIPDEDGDMVIVDLTAAQFGDSELIEEHPLIVYKDELSDVYQSFPIHGQKAGKHDSPSIM